MIKFLWGDCLSLRNWFPGQNMTAVSAKVLYKVTYFAAEPAGLSGWSVRAILLETHQQRKEPMKVLILSGSRNPQGQTARAVGAFVEGLSSAGAEHQVVFLTEKKIERCRQCDANGWGTCRTEGRCCQQDDFAGLVEQLRLADAVAFATPVYYGDLSESLRAFLDRLRRIACWHETGKQGIAGKPALGICVAGGGGGGAPNCTVQLEKVLHHCGMDVVDMVPARRQNLEMKLGVLNHVGRWFAAVDKLQGGKG